MFYITTNQGVRIACYDLNPTCKECVVMIHGWPLSEKIFEYQKGMLASRGYRVVTIDLRGFGNSDTPARGYCYDDFASDIFAVIRKMGLRSFTLVGFSMGGAISCRYMSRFNGFGVKKLCLLGAALPRYTQTEDFPYGVTKESVDELINQARIDRAQLCEDFSGRLLYNPHTMAIKDWFKSIALSASGIGTIGAGYALRDEDCRNDMSAIRVPTGIFHGVQDEIVPYELGELQCQCIEGSRLFTFECSGHAVFYDELELFNNTFLAFLES